MDARQAAGYYRVSQTRDGMKAPELYEDEIRRYCSYRGIDLGPIFSDIDYSGYKNSEKRPALAELVRRRHEFSAVVVPKLSRFGRSLKHLTQLFETFDAEGISLVFLDLGMDTSTSQGRLLRNIMASFAEYESDVRSDYARANHRRVRADGRPWGGRPPFGYERDPRERSYTIHEDRAEIIRRIFASYIDGQSQGQIARDLNRKELLRPSGAQWRQQEVGRILDNPAYAALAIVDDDFVPAVWAPIVDDETWAAVRALRAAHLTRTRQLRVKRTQVYLLSGFIICGHCGKRLHHRTRPSSPGGIYTCRDSEGRRCPGGSVGAQRADDYVTRRFLERCDFVWDKGDAVQNMSPQRRWERATIPERRRLLELVIKEVVLEPWPASVEPCRAGGLGRELTVHWTRTVAGEGPLAVVASKPRPDLPRRDVSEGRVEMLRAAEVAGRARRASALSERARASRSEWQRFRQERLIDAGVPASVIPGADAACAPNGAPARDRA
jgi:DNA invertase Pin-like site-specific DNA recombinase